MEERIMQLVVWLAPTIAGAIGSVSISLIIKKVVLRALQKKIDEVNEGNQLRQVNEKLDRIDRHINEMRGKRR